MKTVLVMYGGVCPEHEVSIVSALQVMNALKEAGFGVLPLYISKEGGWYLGGNKYLKAENYKDLQKIKDWGKRVIISADREWDLLAKGWLGFGGMEEKIDTVFPVFHGQYGEDGAIQGLLEHADLPYVGCGVTASGVGIDKYVAKRVAESLGVRVTKDVLATVSGWKKEKKELVKEIEKLKWPIFIKPARLGSSIGVVRLSKKKDLTDAVEVAFRYGSRVVVEEAVKNPIEINISVLGNDPYQCSVTERPVTVADVLSFEDKYIGEGGKSKGMASAKRIIPAPVSEKIKNEVEGVAVNIFRAIDGKGISRFDFIVNEKDEVYFNEVNTMPGSLAFYLWEASGVSFKKLVIKLVRLAEEEWKAKKKLVSVFNSNILAGFAKRGIKGGRV
ncbi:D-alanine--D-alanine ligase [Patescibacteria group bacterium]|nr:D-alanine--D-alanine ligase [Patescibacteria group bacterium]MBU1256750.1 D-alanine--D-alanine ligase [Patescibacteria group bacterium]MBU1457831.1 D-alanine--D-alanine ligase [Patescibacteria group bacterium]